MKDSALRRLTGVSALASVAIWLAIFPLYTLGDPAVSLYDGAAIAQDLFRLRNVVFTRILLGLAVYIRFASWSRDRRHPTSLETRHLLKYNSHRRHGTSRRPQWSAERPASSP